METDGDIGDKRNKGPERCPCPLLWNLRICYFMWQKGTLSMWLRTWGWRDDPGHSRWIQCVPKGPCRGRRRQERVRERDVRKEAEVGSDKARRQGMQATSIMSYTLN